MQTQRNIGQNRGKPRLWIEGKFLLEAGFTPGLRYNFSFDQFWLDPKGTRKVSGKGDRPIIDISGAAVPKADFVELTILEKGIINVTEKFR